MALGKFYKPPVDQFDDLLKDKAFVEDILKKISTVYGNKFINDTLFINTQKKRKNVKGDEVRSLFKQYYKQFPEESVMEIITRVALHFNLSLKGVERHIYKKPTN